MRYINLRFTYLLTNSETEHAREAKTELIVFMVARRGLSTSTEDCGGRQSKLN